jgi:hypothetical protein
MVWRPTGTDTIGPTGWPSSSTLALGGSMARPIFAGVLAEMFIVDAGKDASLALATSTARPATRVSGSVR